MNPFEQYLPEFAEEKQKRLKKVLVSTETLYIFLYQSLQRIYYIRKYCTK